MTIALKLNFKKSLITFSTLLVGLAVVISNAIAYLGTEQLLMDRTEDQMKTALTTQAESFRQKIFDLEEDVSSLAQLVDNITKESAKDIDAAELSKISSMAAQLMNAEAVIIGFDNNTLYSSTQTGPYSNQQTELAQQRWYQQANQAYQLSISDPFRSTITGNQVISLAKRFSNGFIIALISTDIMKTMVDQARRCGYFCHCFASRWHRDLLE